jgi:hypothetical protein
MGTSRLPRDANGGLPPLRWLALAARRDQFGDGWPPNCPLCQTPLGTHEDDVRWLADNGRLVELPDGCGAHRYCAIENPNRNPALIAEHEHGPAHGAERRRADRRRG